MREQVGVTELYNLIEEGAFADVAAAHAELDQAVAAAFGWATDLASDPVRSNTALLDLHQKIIRGEASNPGPRI